MTLYIFPFINGRSVKTLCGKIRRRDSVFNLYIHNALISKIGNLYVNTAAKRIGYIDLSSINIIKKRTAIQAMQFRQSEKIP